MLSAIRKELHISKSTASLWLRDIELTPAQRNKIFKGRDYSRFIGGEKKKALRVANTKKLFEQGKNEAHFLMKDSIFVAGVMLYWAEGAKTTERIKFSNADPAMISFMMLWFRKICKVPENKFRIAIHTHTLHMRKDIEKYWSQITGIPQSQFFKTYVKQTSLNQRRNILYNGTCTICICDVALFRRMMGWKAGILDKYDISMSR